MNGIVRSAINTPDILVDESAESELKALLRRRQFAVVIIVCTLILAFFFPKVAVAGYIVGTILFFLIPSFSAARARWIHTNRLEGESGKKSSQTSDTHKSITMNPFFTHPYSPHYLFGIPFYRTIGKV